MSRHWKKLGLLRTASTFQCFSDFSVPPLLSEAIPGPKVGKAAMKPPRFLMVDGSGGELSLYPKERPWNFCADQHDQHDQLTKNLRIAIFFQGQWHHVDSPVDTQNGNLSGNIFLLGCELLATRLRCAFVIVDAIHGEFLILEESHRSYSWRYPHDIPIVVG